MSYENEETNIQGKQKVFSLVGSEAKKNQSSNEKKKKQSFKVTFKAPQKGKIQLQTVN